MSESKVLKAVTQSWWIITPLPEAQWDPLVSSYQWYCEDISDIHQNSNSLWLYCIYENPKPCVRAEKSAEQNSGASLPVGSLLGAMLQTDLSPFEGQKRVVFSIPLDQLYVQRHFRNFSFPLPAVCVVANTEGNVRKTEGKSLLPCLAWHSPFGSVSTTDCQDSAVESIFCVPHIFLLW